VSSDAIVDILTFVDTGLASLESMDAVEALAGEVVAACGISPAPEAPAPEAKGPYSVADLSLFQALTGYRLAARETIWVVVDEDGKRAPFADRLFTTLAEEAFRFADRRRQAGDFPDDDLTLGDLASALGPLQRIAAEIGSRGVSAFRRLEAVLAAHGRPPAPSHFEALQAMSAP
jgi:hypothetical protein